MPTYSSNNQLIPTEYIPINYGYEHQYDLAAAQIATSNAARVKSRYEDLLGMELSTNKSKEALSGFMKEKEKTLQQLTGTDLLGQENVSKALGLFKPLTDPNGEYSFIAGDHAYTSKIQSIQSQIENSKTKDKGANYNKSLEDTINAQAALFSTSNNPSDWKKFYYSAEEYTPYYDAHKEINDLEKEFRDAIGDGNTTSEIGGGRIKITTDKSIYASELNDYLQTHLSDKAKSQLKIDKKAEFWNQNLPYYMEKDPSKKQQMFSLMRNNMLNEYNQQKEATLDFYGNQKKTYEKGKAFLNASNNKDLLLQYQNAISTIDKKIKSVSEQSLDDNTINKMLDSGNWATAQDSFSERQTANTIENMAKAGAHKKISEKLEADDTYWKLVEHQDRMSQREWEKTKFGFEMLAKGFKKDGKGGYMLDTVTEPTPLETEQLSGSKAENGLALYKSEQAKIADHSNETFSAISEITNDGSVKKLTPDSKHLANSYEKEKDNLSQNTIELINSVYGKNANISNLPLSEVLSKVSRELKAEGGITKLLNNTINNPELTSALIKYKTASDIKLSQLEKLNKDFKNSIDLNAPTMIASDGVSFEQFLKAKQLQAGAFSNFDYYSDKKNLDSALAEFNKHHNYNHAWRIEPDEAIYSNEESEPDVVKLKTEYQDKLKVARAKDWEDKNQPWYKITNFSIANNHFDGENTQKVHNEYIQKIHDLNSGTGPINNILETFYDERKENGIINLETTTYPIDKESRKIFETKLKEKLAYANSKNLNEKELLFSFPNLVTKSQINSKEGALTAQLSLNPDSDGKSFMEAYNSKAKDMGLEEASTPIEAINSFNTHMKSTFIPSTVIPKKEGDETLGILLGSKDQVTVFQINQSEQKDLGLNLGKNYKLSFSNDNKNQSKSSFNLTINGSYPKLDLTPSGKVQYNQDGSPKIIEISGDKIFNDLRKSLSLQDRRDLSDEQQKRKVGEMIINHPDDIIKNISYDIYLHMLDIKNATQTNNK